MFSTFYPIYVWGLGVIYSYTYLLNSHLLTLTLIVIE